MKCPYLFLSAFIWGIKTIHPNSFKLLTLKFPKYKILKKFFVHLSCCQRSKKDQELKESSNFIFNVSSFYFSFDLLTRFPPTNEEGIRLIILQHLQQISMPETGIKQVEGIIISWRAWMKIFSIENLNGQPQQFSVFFKLLIPIHQVPYHDLFQYHNRK